jgi:hypothetical protein
MFGDFLLRGTSLAVRSAGHLGWVSALKEFLLKGGSSLSQKKPVSRPFSKMLEILAVSHNLERNSFLSPFKKQTSHQRLFRSQYAR